MWLRQKKKATRYRLPLQSSSHRMGLIQLLTLLLLRGRSG